MTSDYSATVSYRDLWYNFILV